MIRIQEGIRIKSKDMNFGIYIFYLALKLFIDNFINTQKKFIRELFSSRMVYLLAYKN